MAGEQIAFHALQEPADAIRLLDDVGAIGIFLNHRDNLGQHALCLLCRFQCFRFPWGNSHTPSYTYHLGYRYSHAMSIIIAALVKAPGFHYILALCSLLRSPTARS